MFATKPTPLRGSVIGLGMMGRHHARLLQSSNRVDFVGAVDPAGDRFGSVRSPSAIYPTVEALLARTSPDFAIVAVPTEDHLATVRILAAAGVNMLIEKPLAATSEEGHEIITICETTGVRAAVGHVERFNPALRELRRRVQDGDLGEVFLISTERVGPFPHRIRDVGVVKDLATHDIDLVCWLGGSSVAGVAARTQHRAGRPHEDLVLMTGNLESEVSFNCVVDWLSPTKVRRTRALGERGMLLADTLSSDLFLFQNGQVSVEWEATQQFKGVTEGDMTRFALERREPLLAELEAFCAFVAGDDGTGIVTLAEGLDTLASAEAVLESARTGQTIEPARV